MIKTNDIAAFTEICLQLSASGAQYESSWNALRSEGTIQITGH